MAIGVVRMRLVSLKTSLPLPVWVAFQYLGYRRGTTSLFSVL